MIHRRLVYINFFFRFTILLLPLFAFAAAAYVRFVAGGVYPFSIARIEPADYFGLLCFTTLVWAVITDYYDLVNLKLLLARRRWAKNAF